MNKLLGSVNVVFSGDFCMFSQITDAKVVFFSDNQKYLDEKNTFSCLPAIFEKLAPVRARLSKYKMKLAPVRARLSKYKMKLAPTWASSFPFCILSFPSGIKQKLVLRTLARQ